MTERFAIPADEIARNVQLALTEDVGSGDITAGLIPPDAIAHAGVISREEAVLCGSAWFDEVFRQIDPRVSIAWTARDGDRVRSNQPLCTLRGPARSVLTGERTALNFLQTLSGTATTTHDYVRAVHGTGAIILDTRKTIPGLRLAQKYAVTCGGGRNHRIGLYDGILIKENHIMASGSIAAAMRAAREQAHGDMLLEVEVENLEQLRQALEAGAQRLLLDNFTIDALRKAVQAVAGRARLEASGGITLENIRAFAETGVDFISLGSLTKHIRAIDLSLRFETGR
jgi:nicotinate-nucleotide pyrophosphorylase (carboxylating)